MVEAGLICAAAGTVALIILPLVWRHQDAKAAETEHDRFVREWQRANYAWRHPRASRHLRKHRLALRARRGREEAPLPMEWW